MNDPFEMPILQTLPVFWHKDSKSRIGIYEQWIRDTLHRDTLHRDRSGRESPELWLSSIKESIVIINELIDIANRANDPENDVNYEDKIQRLHAISAHLPGSIKHEPEVLWLSPVLTIILIGLAWAASSLAFFTIFFGILAAASASLFFAAILDVRVSYSRSLYNITKDVTEELCLQRNLRDTQNRFTNMQNFIQTLQGSSELEVTESALWLERATYKHNNQTHVLGLIRTFFNPKRVCETSDIKQKRKIVDEEFHHLQPLRI